MSIDNPVLKAEWMQPSKHRTTPVSCVKSVNTYYVGDVIYADPYYAKSLVASYKTFGPYWKYIRQCRKPS